MRLDHGRGADVEASERRLRALTAKLDGLELVEGLDALTVEVGLVAHDLCEGVRVGKEAAADLLRDGAALSTLASAPRIALI